MLVVRAARAWLLAGSGLFSPKVCDRRQVVEPIKGEVPSLQVPFPRGNAGRRQRGDAEQCRIEDGEPLHVVVSDVLRPPCGTGCRCADAVAWRAQNRDPSRAIPQGAVIRVVI